MTAFIITIGVLNIAIGFSMVLFVRDRARARFLGRAPMPTMEETADEPPADETKPGVSTVEADAHLELGLPSHDTPPSGPVSSLDPEVPEDDKDDYLDPAGQLEQIPRKWLEMLEQAGIEANGLVEATAQVLRLEVGSYRNQLVQFDRKARQRLSEGSTEGRDLVESLCEANEGWLAELTVARAQLVDNVEKMGGDRACAERLRKIIDRNSSAIDVVATSTADLDLSRSTKAGWRIILHHIRILLDFAHALRDAMFVTLIEIKDASSGLDNLDRRLQFDGLTGLNSRGGLEKVFQDFYRGDPHHQRQVSCTMIDIDNFGTLLEAHGPVVCDQLLVSLAGLLTSMLRKERGFDLAARYAGQRFVCFFADTGPQNAVAIAERTRQKVDRTIFQSGNEQLHVTISCGVSEFIAGDTTKTLFARLEAATEYSKHNGRNCVSLHDGHRPKDVKPPRYEVQDEVIELG